MPSSPPAFSPADCSRRPPSPPAATAAAAAYTPTCPNGKVYSQQKQKCIDAQSNLIDDQSLTTYAYVLAKQGRYEEALETLDLLKDPNTAEALNYRGYATRKLGRIDEGIGYYLKAVALDPELHARARISRRGLSHEGRRRARAKEQLSEIEKRCGTTCEPYGDLAEAIAAANI